MDGVSCQLRVLKGDSYAPCGAEAVASQFYTLPDSLPGYGDPPGPVALALALCERHKNEGAEQIGERSADELRTDVTSGGASPGF